MKARIDLHGRSIEVDLSAPIDISIPLKAGIDNVNAWYVDPMSIEPVRTEMFTGSVKEGGNVNFRNIAFNPHGNGTHTECVGHIALEVHSINTALQQFFYDALLITIAPEQVQEDVSEWVKSDDAIITREQLIKAVGDQNPKALIVRTTPNTEAKKTAQYSNSNWPYLQPEAAAWLAEKDIEHLLVDLPSVDREFDGGKMLAHRAFWSYPENTRHKATITELIYVNESIEDGAYLLQLSIASFENDASPSKPVLYKPSL